MRYPKPLPKNGTIGFIAPSFGCAIEPYKSRFESAKRILSERGFSLKLGKNCYEGSGIGISNTPDKCAAELNEAMTDDSIDAIITCGGGELMCEVVPRIDFKRIAESEPKWYMGYSDNTNFTFLSATLADTAAIYGPCAPAFGRTPWHASVEDALKLLTGEIAGVESYELWELYDPETPEGEEPDPLLPYNVTEPVCFTYHLPGGSKERACRMHGRLIGGCMDILQLLCGTKYDRVSAFTEKYREDGLLWFLECCDLDPLSIRRAFWALREAGWFNHASGFLIGRPLHYGEEALGVDQYNAVTDILGDLNVPIIMDVDIGHRPPMMPIVTGAVADVNAEGNKLKLTYKYE